MKDHHTEHLLNLRQGQVISTLFNGITLEDREHYNFGVITCFGEPFISSRRPINILAWFKYRHEDKYITVNYYSFPKNDFLETDIYDRSGQQSHVFYQEIIYNNRIVNPETAKQLIMPLPAGLQGDALLKQKLRKMQKGRRRYATVGGGDSYVYGFMFNNKEFVFSKNSFAAWQFFYYEVEQKILMPITDHIFYHETPDDWKIEMESQVLKRKFDPAPLKVWMEGIKQ